MDLADIVGGLGTREREDPHQIVWIIEVIGPRSGGEGTLDLVGFASGSPRARLLACCPRQTGSTCRELAGTASDLGRQDVVAVPISNLCLDPPDVGAQA